MNAGHSFLEGTRGPYRNLTDYILGITHEIWESRQVARIHDYYSADCVIYTLGGIIRGAATVVRNTEDTLAAFPDRLLLGDDVVWSHEGPGHFYSSHRISSPMTNRGATAYGPATGRAVMVRTIADCVVENGVITREWLVRDNYGLVGQLGFNPLDVARQQAGAPKQQEHVDWLAAEQARVRSGDNEGRGRDVAWSSAAPAGFAASALRSAWIDGEPGQSGPHYSAYAVLHDSAPLASGAAAVRDRYRGLRSAFSDAAISLDHLCVQPADSNGHRVAARWTLSARHTGDAWGLPATGRSVLILGVTHWHIVAGKIASEWTIFDRIAVLAQLLGSP